MAADAHRYDLFERVFIGLLDAGRILGFFDVQDAPRRNQPPALLMSIDAMVSDIVDGARVRHFGRSDDRYLEDDPTWEPPGHPPA